MNFFSLFKRNFLYKIKKKINVDLDGVDYKTLDELFHHYGSDKANIFKKTQSKGHGFSEFYAQHLETYRDKKINILEIGSYAGASAAAFVKYFPKSVVYCLDINISKFDYTSKNINVHGLDVNNKNSLNKIFKDFNINEQLSFDIIIDDGSHYLSDILFSLKIFFKYLKKNGIYVIEDFKHPNYYSYNRNVNDILVDKMLSSLNRKELFQSKIIKEEDQNYLLNNIEKISIYRGNLKDSDICFLEKK